MIRKAVIVAAGLSSRLYPLTESTPKPLLRIGNESLLDRSIRLLAEAGVQSVGVVAGFRADLIAEACNGSAQVIANPFFRQCNNMGSLWMSRDFADGDPFIYLHGDLVYDGRLLRALSGDGSAASAVDLLVDFSETDDEAMKVRTDVSGHLAESSKSITSDNASGEWIGIAAIHRPKLLFNAIERYLMTDGLTDYDTAAFTAMARDGAVIRCIPTEGMKWREIDDAADLESARNVFSARV
jgi:L-glutamine-phosphate cytidylyltransferase